MSQLTQCTIMLLAVHSTITASVDLVNILPVTGETAAGTCPAQESRDAAIQNIKASVDTLTQNLKINHNCGLGESLWYRVAHLNMNNSSQQCPSAWREYNSSGVRGCRRPEASCGNCPATFYPTNLQYSRVCGRVIGYQIGSTDAFGYKAFRQTIDSYYVYGVSVTHGAPRNHIWTLAAGVSEVGEYRSPGAICPCVNFSHSGRINPPWK